MIDDDKWLDEIFSTTEREEIRSNISAAIKSIYNFRVKDALNILESLYDSLEDSEGVEKLLTEIEEMPKPKYWTQPHRHTHWDSQTYTVKEDPVNINVDVIAELRRELEMQKEELQKEIERELLAKRELEIPQRAEAVPDPDFDVDEEPWKAYLDALKRGDWPTDE
jgi:hypothetical protein